MTFQTIPGSGSAPDTFLGTSGVDSITITNGKSGDFLTAAAADDFISYNTTFLEPNVLSGAQLYGGQGSDSFADLGSGNANANFVLLTSSLINGNIGNDNIGTPGAGNGITAVTSSIYGGQGNDVINLARVSSSLVNGNKDADTINLNGGLYSSASIYGGQGADTVTLNDQGNAAANETYTNSLISLDRDNDSFSVAAAIASFTGSSVLGGQGNDTISAANAGASFFIDGGADNDALTGDTQNDTIAGGDGNDTLTGANGADQMTGGAGTNIFAYTAVGQGGAAQLTGANAIATGGDSITGFTSGSDDLRFNAASLSAGLSASAAAAVNLNGWDADLAGVALANFTLAFTAGTTTATAVSTAIGTVNFDAAQTGYIGIQTGAGTGIWNFFQVTTSAARAAAALTLDGASDSIAYLGTVNVNGAGTLAVGDIVFN